jgi:hypothetical protein
MTTLVQHTHCYEWQVEPQGTAWVVYPRCRDCCDEFWGCTARSSDELNDELRRAFRAGELSALAYWTAPVEVPA